MRPTWRHLVPVALLASFLSPGAPAHALPPPTEPGEQPAAGAASADASGRRWPMPIPEGCTTPELAQVVFLGTVVDTDFQTARYRIDQVRAGDLQPYAYGGLVDVRYGDDTRFLSEDSQYLIGATAPDGGATLASRVRVTEPLFAGDDVIGITENEISCPRLDEPARTLDADGTDVDAGVLDPLSNSKGDVLRAVLLPVAIALAIVFGLATVRWILTGMGKGVASVVSTASQTREVRAARRKDV
ncbi:MAG: hypothetical protein ACRDZ2_17095 [Ilumatobacteraceae bacterium]